MASFRDIGQSLVSLRDIGRFWQVSARLKEYGIDLEILEELWRNLRESTLSVKLGWHFLVSIFSFVGRVLGGPLELL